MIRRLLVAAALIVIEFSVASTPVSAAGSVTITAWSCPATIDAATATAETFASTCTTEAANSTFALTSGDVTRRRATAPSKPASWPAVSGAFTIHLDNPPDLPAVVFCKRDDGPFERFEAPQSEIKGELAVNSSLTCQWYLVPAAPAPTATTQPTATTPPTATKPAVQPTATIRPTSTPVPTSTPLPTATPTEAPTVEPTPTEAELPPMPSETFTPTQYRANSAHTGEQEGPGPSGDPVLLWRTAIGTPKSNPNVRTSSPVLSGGMLYAGGDTGMLAIDAADGSERWRFETDRPVMSTPAVVAGLVFFGAENGYFYCLNQENGELRWQFQAGGMIIASPMIEDGVVYFTSYDSSLYALDLETGEEIWRFNMDGSEFVAAPAYADGVIYVADGDIDGGFLYAVDSESGEMLWRHHVAGNIGSTPAIADGVVYFGSDDGYLYALDIASQDRLWRFSTDKLVRSSPAVVDGTIYVGNRFGFLYAIDAETGQERWHFETGDWLDSSPVVVDGVVYAGSKDDNFYAFSADDGSVIWNYALDHSVTTSPVVSGSVAYFTARDGYLYAITGSDDGGTPVEPTQTIEENGGESGGQTANGETPNEIELGGTFYRFDRIVTIDPNSLAPVDQLDGTTVLSHLDGTADEPLYIGTGESEDSFARYLPELIGSGDIACRSDVDTSAVAISDGQSTFAFAGEERDLTVDQLAEIVPDSPLGPVYAETADPPFVELYIVTDDVVQRFIVLDDEGRPSVLQDTVTFGGQVFEFSGDVTDETNPGELVPIGCAGPFGMYAIAEQADAPFGRILALIGGRYLAFDATEAAVPDLSTANREIARE